MNSLTRIMSYDKTKNQENCDCVECTNVKVENQIVEYPPLSDEEIEQIIKERYFDKDEKTKIFIKRSLQTHGNKYDYSKSILTKSNNKIEIICRVKNHHSFFQRKYEHFNGQGCPLCGKISRANTKRRTLESFISECKNIHGNNYDYSYVVYKTCDTKIKIKCNSCQNIFEMTPYHHMNRKQGCPFCKGRKNTMEKFIPIFNQIHNYKYDYSESEYRGYDENIKIKCKDCGTIFQQNIGNHMKFYGCPTCMSKILSSKFKMGIENFIQKSKLIHKNKYNYDKFIYIDYKTKGIIHCNQCDFDFEQSPSHHLKGYGCPKCQFSKGELQISIYLESLNIIYIPQYKFKDCKYTKELPFDFYLPKYNLCIEYDGECHFKKINWNGHLTEKQMENNLKSYQMRDKIKNDYCKSHNINLLRIRYDENVEEKLKNYFKINRIYQHYNQDYN